MQRRVLASIHVLVLGVVCGMIPSYGADQVMHAEVERGAATAYHLDDPDLAGFKVKFGIRVTNLSGVPIDLPKPGTSEDGTDLFTMPEIDVKQPDGNWAHLVQSSWYGTSSIKYESCRPLSPGAVKEFRELASGFVLLKRQLASLGNKPTVRFTVMFFCRKPDGSLTSNTVRTEGFVLKLPTQP